MASVKRVTWSPQSQEDVRTIWRYYAAAASLETANRIASRILETGAGLKENPLAWRSRDTASPEFRAAFARPYAVFYRISGDSIEIVRVLHGRRDAAAIFSKEPLGDK